MKYPSLLTAAVAVIAVTSACAATPAPRTPAPQGAASAASTPVFTALEIEIIRDYYRDHSSTAAAHGKGKHKSLPPGIAKNLARGKPLPPGIAKRALPGDLAAALPPVRTGHERVIIDGRVLLVEIATQVVRDVLYDIVMPS